MDCLVNGWLPLKTIAIPSGPFAVSPKPLTILPSQNCTFFRSTHHIVRVVVLPPSAAPGWGQTREVLHTARPVFAAYPLEYFRVGRVFRNENCLENCILNHLGIRWLSYVFYWTAVRPKFTTAGVAVVTTIVSTVLKRSHCEVALLQIPEMCTICGCFRSLQHQLKPLGQIFLVYSAISDFPGIPAMSRSVLNW